MKGFAIKHALYMKRTIVPNVSLAIMKLFYVTYYVENPKQNETHKGNKGSPKAHRFQVFKYLFCNHSDHFYTSGHIKSAFL